MDWLSLCIIISYLIDLVLLPLVPTTAFESSNPLSAVCAVLPQESSGNRALFEGKRSVYITTWSGPALYAVNRKTGHVRWQFPPSNWFRYWIKNIDLPSSASFKQVAEVGDYVHVTAAGAPGNVYGLQARTSTRLWEYRPQSKGEEVMDVTSVRGLAAVTSGAGVESGAWPREGLQAGTGAVTATRKATPAAAATSATGEGVGAGMGAAEKPLMVTPAATVAAAGPVEEQAIAATVAAAEAWPSKRMQAGAGEGEGGAVGRAQRTAATAGDAGGALAAGNISPAAAATAAGAVDIAPAAGNTPRTAAAAAAPVKDLRNAPLYKEPQAGTTSTAATAAGGHADTETPEMTEAPAAATAAASGVLYMAVADRSNTTSWVVALDAAAGTVLWRSPLFSQAVLHHIVLHNGSLLLVTSEGADLIVAINTTAAAAAAAGPAVSAATGATAAEVSTLSLRSAASTLSSGPAAGTAAAAAILGANAAAGAAAAGAGGVLWQRQGPFCGSPSPIDVIYDQDVLLVASDCGSLGSLVALNVTTGEQLWSWVPRQPPPPPAAAAAAAPSSLGLDVQALDWTEGFGVSANAAAAAAAVVVAVREGVGLTALAAAAGSQGYDVSAAAAAARARKGAGGNANIAAAAAAAAVASVAGGALGKEAAVALSPQSPARSGSVAAVAAGPGPGEVTGPCSWFLVHHDRVVFYCDCTKEPPPPPAASGAAIAAAAPSAAAADDDDDDGDDGQHGVLDRGYRERQGGNEQVAAAAPVEFGQVGKAQLPAGAAGGAGRGSGADTAAGGGDGAEVAAAAGALSWHSTDSKVSYHSSGSRSMLEGHFPFKSSSASSYGSAVAANRTCVFALGLTAGRTLWSSSLVSNGTVPLGAQARGFKPLAHLGTVLVILDTSVHALDTSRGEVVWGYELGAGQKVGAMQTPVIDCEMCNGTVVVGSTSARNKTVITALDLVTGKFKWGRTVNGTAQEAEEDEGPGRPKVAGMVLVGGRVLVETCQGVSCCLRAFNASTGQKRWVVCVEAERGVDATHPQAQFAIWLVTLITGGSIILLIIVAIVLYVHRLRDEKHLLLHEEEGGLIPDEGSPRSGRHPWHPSSHRVLSEAVQKGLSGITPTRNYRPLPYRPPDPEDDDSPRRRFEGSPAVVGDMAGGGGGHGGGLGGIVAGGGGGGLGGGRAGGDGGGNGRVMEAREGQVVEGGRWYGTLPRVQHGSS